MLNCISSNICPGFQATIARCCKADIRYYKPYARSPRTDLINWKKVVKEQKRNSKEIGRSARAVTDLTRSSVPPLEGVVLAGGRSSRMESDKTVLAYHGKPQREYIYRHLEEICGKASLSCRPDQVEDIPCHLDTIPDSFVDMGPMGALLSAFEHNPDIAWLAVACDLPLLSFNSLEYLVKNRNASKMATAYVNPGNMLPEPLITIWEPESYPVLLHFLGLGYASPQKVLINSHIELLEIRDPKELTNVNRPDEYEEVLSVLSVSAY